MLVVVFENNFILAAKISINEEILPFKVVLCQCESMTVTVSTCLHDHVSVELE